MRSELLLLCDKSKRGVDSPEGSQASCVCAGAFVPAHTPCSATPRLNPPACASRFAPRSSSSSRSWRSATRSPRRSSPPSSTVRRFLEIQHAPPRRGPSPGHSAAPAPRLRRRAPAVGPEAGPRRWLGEWTLRWTTSRSILGRNRMRGFRVDPGRPILQVRHQPRHAGWCSGWCVGAASPAASPAASFPRPLHRPFRHCCIACVHAR
jgi:hypothetical protein